MTSKRSVRIRWASVEQALALLGCVVAVLSSQTSVAQSIAVTHCQGECPSYNSRVTANQSNVVIHHLYAAGINATTALPDWVAYRLTSEAIGVASLLPRSWQADRLIKYSRLEDVMQSGEEELQLSQNIARNANPYAGSGTETVKPDNRARLAPMTSFANTPYWSDLNNFSNMVPMPAALRLGPWLQLEQRLNNIVASEAGEAYVIAGPLFLISMLGTTPSSADLSPAAYFKLVADESGVAAFLFSRDMAPSESYCSHRTTLAEIEDITDVEFFPGRRTVRESSALLAKLGCE